MSKVCPSCGAEPWNCAEWENPKIEGTRRNSCEPRQQPNFCEDCGDKLIERSELPRDIWKDPAVREALKSRSADDICLLRCPECDELGYYNQGSGFTCRFCDKSYYVLSEGEDVDEGVAAMNADDIMALADSITETTDGYHNRTV